MKTILAPVDFSSVTENVVLEAATIARALDGRVVLLNVTQPPPVVADSSAFMMDVSAVTEFAAKAAVPQLEALQEKLAHDYVATETMQQTGYPLTLILEQARKLPADYIVMGSRPHGILRPPGWKHGQRRHQAGAMPRGDCAGPNAARKVCQSQEVRTGGGARYHEVSPRRLADWTGPAP